MDLNTNRQSISKGTFMCSKSQLACSKCNICIYLHLILLDVLSILLMKIKNLCSFYLKKKLPSRTFFMLLHISCYRVSIKSFILNNKILIYPLYFPVSLRLLCLETHLDCLFCFKYLNN